jgi:hypothetical protein
LFLEQGQHLLLSARKRAVTAYSYYVIGSNPDDLAKGGASSVGGVRCSLPWQPGSRGGDGLRLCLDSLTTDTHPLGTSLPPPFPPAASRPALPRFNPRSDKRGGGACAKPVGLALTAAALLLPHPQVGKLKANFVGTGFSFYATSGKKVGRAGVVCFQRWRRPPAFLLAWVAVRAGAGEP